MSIIRQGAFGGERPLKGALHCHTTRSDGAGSPGDVIRYHKAHGYDFMALTDHRVFNYESFAPDAEMTIIPGMEFDNGIEHENGFRTYHTVVLGGDGTYAQDERFDSGTAADQDGFQRYLDAFHARGCLTLYCHPEWSSTPARYFERLRGNFAMEVWNSGCAIENRMDTNAAYWDELLGQGVRINGAAVDDGHAMSHHCLGWVMVNAKNDVAAILDALGRGAYYSSCGPVIKDFYIEDGRAVLDCEAGEGDGEVAEIRFLCDRHPTRIAFADNMPLTHAETSLGGEYPYVRAVVADRSGRLAWTNPIYVL